LSYSLYVFKKEWERRRLSGASTNDNYSVVIYLRKISERTGEIMQRLFHYLRLCIKTIGGKQLPILLLANQLQINDYGKINFYRTDNYHHLELL
jgi:hypothetical protein